MGTDAESVGDSYWRSYPVTVVVCLDMYYCPLSIIKYPCTYQFKTVLVPELDMCWQTYLTDMLSASWFHCELISRGCRVRFMVATALANDMLFTRGTYLRCKSGNTSFGCSWVDSMSLDFQDMWVRTTTMSTATKAMLIAMAVYMHPSLA